MKKITQFAGLIGIILLTLSSCTQQVMDVTDEIKAANEKLTTAFSNGDYESLANLYTADAKIFPQNAEIVQGKEALQESWKGMLNMGISQFNVETIEAKSYGKTAVEEGRYEVYVGDQLVDHGKYIVIWEKVDGEWKIALDIPNSSVPVPAPSPENE